MTNCPGWLWYVLTGSKLGEAAQLARHFSPNQIMSHSEIQWNHLKYFLYPFRSKTAPTFPGSNDQEVPTGCPAGLNEHFIQSNHDYLDWTLFSIGRPTGLPDNNQGWLDIFDVTDTRVIRAFFCRCGIHQQMHIIHQYLSWAIYNWDTRF